MQHVALSHDAAAIFAEMTESHPYYRMAFFVAGLSHVETILTWKND